MNLLRNFGRFVALNVTLLLLFSVGTDERIFAVEVTPRFDRDIVPLLKVHCVKCHGPLKQDGKLDLSTSVGIASGGESGTAVSANNLEESLVWLKISEHEMPPDEPLTLKEQSLIRAWITQGADGIPTPDNLSEVSTEHWSFRQLDRVDVPPVKHTGVCLNEVDHFLQHSLEKKNLSLSEEADRATLIRRVSFDLTGLPPTPREIATYLSDTSANAYSEMVEHYLSSPRYGERWGKIWLDIAGYAESNGYFDSDSERPIAYRYRDYVIRSMNADKPFDQFIREQLAGDELAAGLPKNDSLGAMIEQLEATHFLLNTQDGTAESDGNADEVILDRRAVLDGTIEIFGSALFGLTLQCAKCHDHKFESITQEDYYGLQAILAPAFDVDHWKTPKDRVIEEPSNGLIDQSKPRPMIAAVKDVSSLAPNVYILERGEHSRPGTKVSPSGLQILTDPQQPFSIRSPSPSSSSTGYRLAFAEWLTQADSKPSALLSRLHVNRIWQRYFSVGLVATPENLGVSGDSPSHPELLDWLASYFIDSGWSQKAIHRLIVHSAAYRQRSTLNETAYRIDPDNRLLWRMPLRRLDAESMYDAMLSVSGDLELKMGGPSTPTIYLDVGEVMVSGYGVDARRRAVYIQQRRSQTPTLLRVFDAPSLVTNCIVRLPSTIPLQSLTLLNSDFVLSRASNLAKRLALEAGLESDERIVRAFVLTLGREPDVEELRASLQFIRNQTQQYLTESPVPQRRAWTDFCHSLIASNAFLYLE